MAFIQKTWKDRISDYPNRRTINDGNVTKVVTVGRDEGTVTEAGDDFSASNMNDLEQRIADAYTDIVTVVATEVANQYDGANVIFDTAPTTAHGVGYAVTSDGMKTVVDNINASLNDKADASSLADVATSGDASDVDYDNTVSGLSATKVQGAIDELASEKADTISLATVATTGDYNDLANKPSFTNITSLVTFNETTGGGTRFYYKEGALYLTYQSEAKTHAANDLLFTLPSGYRPSATETIIPCIKNANAYGNVKITGTDGKCVVNVISANSGGRIYFNAVVVL